MQPKILLTDTNRWPVPARLALAFARKGCRVAALCPCPGHPVQSVGAVERVFHYDGFNPIGSLRHAIEAFGPDIVIASCDRGVQHLHTLYATAVREGASGRAIAALIEHSFGAPESFSIVSSRYELLQVAHREGILTPETIPVTGVADLERWSAKAALPWVLKADGTWGGRGVRVAHTVKAAQRSFGELTRRPGAFDLAKGLLLNRDRGWVVLAWKNSRSAVIAQSLINGRPANCAVVCWKGEVLAGIGVEVLRAKGAKGPATLVEVVDSPPMIEAASRIASKLKLSGFFGLDFMIETGTGATYLIEMNPRCTPPCPLPLGKGRDLVAAMWAQLSGEPLPESEPVTPNPRIAYFPGANGRTVAVCDANPTLPSYEDIPREEPALVEELLHPWSGRSLLGQMVDYARNSWTDEGPPEHYPA